MDELNLSENIVRLRHKKKLTQEGLADFLGVTKASVSKWENAQSMPDILLLPRLAAFFDVTIDELVGYKAQLSTEQIRRRYAQLSKGFASLPFEEAWEEARSMARRYYSCYPFLLQLSVLCWNHFMLAETEEKGKQALQEAVGWCERILDGCKDVGMCGDALSVKAGLCLQLGRTAEAIDALEAVSDPGRIAGQEGALLIQAYQMAGELEKAKSHVQIEQYVSLLKLVGGATLSLSLYGDDIARCKETIKRTRGIVELYQLGRLHPNVAAQFYCQAAMVYASSGEQAEALESLRQFEVCIEGLLGAGQALLHGDGYFDLLDTWIERMPLGDMAPRDKEFIYQSIQQILRYPAFEGLKDDKEFRRIAKKLGEGGKNHD